MGTSSSLLPLRQHFKAGFDAVDKGYPIVFGTGHSLSLGDRSIKQDDVFNKLSQSMTQIPRDQIDKEGTYTTVN